MKKTILVLCAVSALMVAQDAAGSYKLTGVDVLYTFITRAENTLTVTDAYGLGVTIPVATIPAAVGGAITIVSGAGGTGACRGAGDPGAGGDLGEPDAGALEGVRDRDGRDWRLAVALVRPWAEGPDSGRAATTTAGRCKKRVIRSALQTATAWTSGHCSSTNNDSTLFRP